MAPPQKETAPKPAAAPPLSGRVAERFVLRECLGAGGMGEVYRADDTRLHRPVALKRLNPELRADERYREHLLKEAHRAAALDTQHIAGVYDVLEDGGELFLVMEYVDGATLRRHLPATYSVADFLDLAVQCGEALVAAHDKGVVHRDIKPENIMLTPGGQVKILDFGLAKQIPSMADQSAPTRTAASSTAREFSGTWGYMAPEVLLQKPSDGRADLFSLGVVFYEMLTGRNPFLGVSFAETVDRTLHRVPVPLTQLKPETPPELEHILTKMLAKDPGERYATARDLVVDLKVLQRQMISGERMPLPAAAGGGRRLASGMIALLLLATVALVGIALWKLLPGPPPATSARPVNPQSTLLAVLPFRTIGGNAESQFYGEGLSETISAKLSKVSAGPGLQVVPAAEVHARHVTDLEQARQVLGVNQVLEGSLQQLGDTVRVNYSLVEAGSGRTLSADTITVKASDPFALQDRVAESIFANLNLSLKPEVRQALASYGTKIAAAYELYLKGTGYLQNYDDPRNIEGAIAAFRDSAALDPNYALAYAGLGQAYWTRYVLKKDLPSVEQARRACQRAAELDPNLPEAHVCLGTLEDGTGHYQQAVAELQKALAGEPNSDEAYRGLAHSYEQLGQTQEAERTYQRALALRPNYWGGYSALGYFYYRQARYDDAIREYQRAIQLAPNNAIALYSLGGLYVAKGRYQEAIDVLRKGIETKPSWGAWSNLGLAYFRLRRFDEAVTAYQQAFALQPQDYRTAGNLADAYYWAPGQRDQAAEAYRRSIQLGEPAAKVNPKDADVRLMLANAYARLGNRSEALRQIDLGLKANPNHAETLYYAALVHNQFGERDAALAWLQKAIQAGWSRAEIEQAVELDDLRSDPRFQKLMAGK
ncbi:MAG TPA: tetratricopeptide repeat protein [Terriglobales bacterium]|nr:tetratricopeptide repeat protein [Terriglobales bacterium]